MLIINVNLKVGYGQWRDIRKGGGEAEVQGADPPRRQDVRVRGGMGRRGARAGDRGHPPKGGQHTGAHTKRYMYYSITCHHQWPTTLRLSFKFHKSSHAKTFPES